MKKGFVYLKISELGNSFNPDRIIVTTCDADSYFHPSYISALTAKFIHEKDPHAVIFQAPLFYNWGLDRVSFVTRVTGLLRSTLMMGALIPFNINSMSIFSFSLRLCIDGDFVHQRLGLSIKDQRWLFCEISHSTKKISPSQKNPLS